MALEFNTIGIKLKYAVEATAGTRPTSNYTEIPDIKDFPDMAMSPSRIEVSNLADKVRRYISGILEAGDDMAFTANLTANLKTVWTALVAAYGTAHAAGKQTWFELAIPNFDSFYWAGEPSDLGINGAGVSAVVETSLHIVPNEIVGFAAASTTTP
jgi:hypothetical protein